jgi:NhaP-type Na+/H+ or K+/H+ antiporter
LLHEPIVAIAVIIVLGVSAQWLAWRIRVPSILLLLTAGILAGPVASMVRGGDPILDPDGLLGELLLPLVSISVGIILFEGGLTLNFRDITGVRSVVWRLVSLGALVSGVLAAIGARLIFGFDWQLAALIGGILVVTGPTVIGPLLTHIRPQGKAGPVLRWEGIVIDPIGALLAVLIFEVILAGGFVNAAGHTVMAVVKTIVIGGGLGVGAALVLGFLLKRYLVPDSLQNPVALLLVVAIFVISGQLQHESGLLATTVMGMVLANWRGVNVHHILEFKENLRVLLISALFVVLGARMTPDDLGAIGWGSALFVLFLIVVVRPASVWAATVGSGLATREKVFLACVAPRGIVAAAVASVFALNLESIAGQREGLEHAGQLVPQTFAVILGTVAFYGLAAGPIAQRLGLSVASPQGVLMVGASPWARDIASVLHKQGFRVLLTDTNHAHVRSARLAGLNAVYGNVLSDETVQALELSGIGHVLALTPNEEVNTLVCQRFVRVFDRAQVFRLHSAAAGKRERTDTRDLPGRRLFSDQATFGFLASRLASGWVVKVTSISDEFTYEDYRTLYGAGAIVLFVISEDRKLTVVTSEREPDPEPGDRVVAIVNPDELLMA